MEYQSLFNRIMELIPPNYKSYRIGKYNSMFIPAKYVPASDILNLKFGDCISLITFDFEEIDIECGEVDSNCSFIYHHSVLEEFDFNNEKHYLLSIINKEYFEKDGELWLNHPDDYFCDYYNTRTILKKVGDKYYELFFGHLSWEGESIWNEYHRKFGDNIIEIIPKIIQLGAKYNEVLVVSGTIPKFKLYKNNKTDEYDIFIKREYINSIKL